MLVASGYARSRMPLTQGGGARTSATFTVQLLGVADRTPEQAVAAVADALSVPSDRAQRMLGGKRFRVTVTARPPTPEASPVVAKLLASGVDLAIVDDETGERRVLEAPRKGGRSSPTAAAPDAAPSSSRAGAAVLTRAIEATGRFRFSPSDGAVGAAKSPSGTGLAPVRLGAAGVSGLSVAARATETTARYSTQQLLGPTPELPGVAARKPPSRGGMPPVAMTPPPTASSPRSPNARPSASGDAGRPQLDSWNEISEVIPHEPSSHRGLRPVPALATDPSRTPLPSANESTVRLGPRYGLTTATPPPVATSSAAHDSKVPPPSNSSSGRPSAPLERTSSSPPSAAKFASAAPSAGPLPSTPPPSSARRGAAVSVPAPSGSALACSDCQAPLGPQATACAACGWDAERQLRRCGRCSGDLVRAVVVGPARLPLWVLAFVVPIAAGVAAFFAAGPSVAGGVLSGVALVELAVRALLASPRCRRCGWTAPAPKPKT